MSNLHDLFLDFNDNISLTKSKKENLRDSRNAIRDKINNYFKNIDIKQPKFCGQGSYMMGTIINPVDEEGEYDLDDGAYFSEFEDEPKQDWPNVRTVHDWIYDALETHTSKSPINKTTCVRIQYAGEYHIDIPSYIKKDDIAYLSHLKEGWIISDPKEFSQWFADKIKRYGEELRRMVKYLKAWKDNQNIKSTQVELSGITITILVAQEFSGVDNRDDLTLLSTITNIKNKLESDFSCRKPVLPHEDLLSDYSKSSEKNLLRKINILKDSLDEAINEEENQLESSKILRKNIFGDRFPKGEDKSTGEDKMGNSDYLQTKNPTILNDDGTSA